MDLSKLDFDGEWKNKRGNTVKSFRAFGESRYKYDGGLGKGWSQYDTWQDASYFGVWVNRTERLTITFAEGDGTLVSCATDDKFWEEIKSMGEFYGDPPAAFTTIDDDGTVTKYYDSRPERKEAV